MRELFANSGIGLEADLPPGKHNAAKQALRGSH
jgi:hypothetical protein